jgi:tetratricopeptide (TPR) repeat protein
MTLLARAYQLNGEYELALESLKRVAEIAPNDMGTRLRTAELLIKMKRPDEALEQIDYALSINPNSVPILRTRAKVLATQGLTDELEETLTRLEQISPETGLGPLGKGRLYRKQEKYEEALAEFEKALEREPESVLYLTELVKTQIAMGDADAALNRVKAVLADDPGNKAAHILLALIYVYMQDYANAEAEFIRQIEINPKSNVPYIQLARIRLQQGNAEGAIQVLQDGLEEMPYNPRLVQTLATVYVQRKELEKATDLYQNILNYAPDNAMFTFGFASLLQRQNRYEEAIFAYQRFLEKHPGNVLIMNNLAALLADHRTDKESLQKAKGLASKLAETNQPALLDTLAWVHYRMGEYSEAIDVLSKVVDKAPNVAVFNYHLGMAYYKQGNKKHAREYLSKAVAEKYDYDGVEEARETLSKLN